MKLTDFIKNIFNKKEANINDIIKISDSFILPNRDIFKNNKEILTLIDKYKDEYNIILSNNKYILSMDLTNNINEKIRMYNALITNIFVDDKDIMEYSIKNKIQMFYKVNKLKMYDNVIKLLYLECMERLIALVEIYSKRKIFLSKNKKEALSFAINNLINALVVFEGQKRAIELEKENFLNKYAIPVFEFEEEIYEEEKQKFFENKIKELNIMLPIINKKFINNNISDILLLERQLEIYVYNNKNKSGKLIERINNYFMQEEYIEYNEIEFRNLEAMVLIFYYYGKNIISDDILYKLYFLKFNYIINLENDKRDKYLSNSLDIEREMYLKIIERKIETILKGNNRVINNVFKLDSTRAIKDIIDELKDNNIFNYKKILYSNKLDLLFSFDTGYGFIKYLDSIKVNKNDYDDKIDFASEIFSWENKIPLSSIYKMLEVGALKKNQNYKSNLYEIYKLFQKNNFSINYRLPEGIKAISIDPLLDIHESTDKMLDNLIEKCKRKIVVLPNSLKYFYGDLYKKNHLKGLELNDNIEFISEDVLKSAPVKKLIIPASLRHIFSSRDFSVYSNSYNRNKLFFEELDTIAFKDYENSKILYDKEMLKCILESTLYIKYFKKNVDGHFGINFFDRVVMTNIKRIILQKDNKEQTFDVSSWLVKGISSVTSKVGVDDAYLFVDMLLKN